MVNNNEIISTILPRGGARIYFDNNNTIVFYPLNYIYNRDIEYIYGTRFRKTTTERSNKEKK